MIDPKNIPYGKRLKSDKDVVMYKRFPNASQTVILSAGKPSPLITGYLANGFIEVEGSNKNERFYIAQEKGLNVVDPNEKDTSNIFDTFFDRIKSTVSNKKDTVTKQAGFLSDGFQETVKDSVSFSKVFDNKIKTYGLGIIGILILIVIIKVFD